MQRYKPIWERYERLLHDYNRLLQKYKAVWTEVKAPENGRKGMWRRTGSPALGDPRLAVTCDEPGCEIPVKAGFSSDVAVTGGLTGQEFKHAPVSV